MKRCPQLARAILSLLTAETCGWERPEAVKGKVLIPVGWSSDMEPLPVSPADARAMAVMLLMACDAAEGKDEQ